MDNNLIILDNQTIPNIPNPGGVQEIVIIDTKPLVISECDNTNITIVDNTPNNQITVSTQEVVVEINNSPELIFKELPCSPTEVFNSPEQELKHIYWGNITGNINLQKDLALALSSIKNSISSGIDEFYTILNNRINTLVSDTNARFLAIEQSIDNIEQSGTIGNLENVSNEADNSNPGSILSYDGTQWAVIPSQSDAAIDIANMLVPVWHTVLQKMIFVPCSIFGSGQVITNNKFSYTFPFILS